MKEKIIIFYFLILSLFCIASCSGEKDGLTNCDIVAAVDSYDVELSELEFRYRLQVQSFLSQYEQFLSIIDLDSSSSFSEQICGFDEEITWAEFFTNAAVDEIISTAYFNLEAEKLDNYGELIQNAEEYASSQLISVSEFATENGVEPETYIKNSYGENLTFELFRKYVSRANIANECCSILLNKISVSEDDFIEYYNSNTEECGKNDYNTVSVRHILIVPKKTENIYFEDGTIDEKSMLEASEKAYGDAEKKASAILEEMTDKGLSPEIFSEYAIHFSEDEGSSGNGGLYENIEKGYFDEVFDEWCFSSDRKVGDCEIIETENGFEIMYFEEIGDKYWRIEALNEIRANNYRELEKTLKEKYKTTVNDDVISYFAKNH